MKLELLTNATVVDDAIRFVASSHQNGYHQQHILSEGEEKAKDNRRAMENQQHPTTIKSCRFICMLTFYDIIYYQF
jgi:hypothetical protein